MTAMEQALLDAGIVSMTDASVDLGEMPAPVAQPGNDPDIEEVQTNQPGDDKKRFMREVTGFGENEGKGNNAKPSLYLTTCNAAFKGWIVEDDAELVQSNYSKGRAKAKGIGWVEEKSAPQQISKVKAMIKLGAMPTVNGPDVLIRASNAIMDKVRKGEKLEKSAGDILLTVARMQIGQPDSELSEEQIVEAMSKKVAAPKVEADLLGTIRDAADKLRTADDLPISEDSLVILDDVVGKLVERIKALGGTTKDRAALEKAEKAKLKAEMAAEKAASRVVALMSR